MTDITHIDVGYTQQHARLLGTRPSILILCGAQDGDTIRDSRTAIKSTGGFPAACTCAICKAIALIMYTNDCSPQVARRKYRDWLHSEPVIE